MGDAPLRHVILNKCELCFAGDMYWVLTNNDMPREVPGYNIYEEKAVNFQVQTSRRSYKLLQDNFNINFLVESGLKIRKSTAYKI